MTTSLRRALSRVLVLPLLTLAIAVGATGVARATPDHFNPHRGPTFNNPYGGRAAAHQIVTKLVRTINSVKKGHKIRIASWNYRSPQISRALIRANQRGVSVRILMDYGNANPDVPNAVARHTQDMLRQDNKGRPHDMTSWLHKCRGSCRGKHGIAHTKFYTFDKVDNTKDVVMYGSVNATELAATIQWNDIYTLTKSQEPLHGVHPRVQPDASRTTRSSRATSTTRGKSLDIGFYPYTRRAHQGRPRPEGAQPRPLHGCARPVPGSTGTPRSGSRRPRRTATARAGDRPPPRPDARARLQHQGRLCDVR